MTLLNLHIRYTHQRLATLSRKRRLGAGKISMLDEVRKAREYLDMIENDLNSEEEERISEVTNYYKELFDGDDSRGLGQTQATETSGGDDAGEPSAGSTPGISGVEEYYD